MNNVGNKSEVIEIIMSPLRKDTKHVILNRQQDKYNTKLLAGFVNAD